MDSYQNIMEKSLNIVIFNMMRLKSKVFLPIGLEINSMMVNLCHENEFKLNGYTFAYYCPIDNSININIDDPFFKECTNEIERNAKMFFILFHEAMHKILMHVPERLGNRHHTLWNIAADYEIHNMYYIYSYINKYEDDDKNVIDGYLKYINNLIIEKKFADTPATPKFLFDMKYIDNIAEEIYEMIEKSKEVSSESFEIEFDCDEDGSGNSGQGSGNQNKQSKSGKGSVTGKVKVTKYKLPDGTEYKDVEIEWPKESQLPDNLKKSNSEKENEQQRQATNRSLLENVFTQIAKGTGKGDSPATCNKFLKKLFHVKVDWVKILRNSLQTILEKSDYFAWNKVRTSTFLLPNMSYLPAIVEDTNKYGTLIVSVDESGSMGDDDIRKAAKIIIDAKGYYKKIIVLKHDTNIASIEQFEELTEDNTKNLLTRKSCGGTSHKEVFEFIKKYNKEHYDEKISCYIGITDMDSDIIECQDIIPANVPVIYLTPFNIDRTYDNIKGKVIPIES